MHASPCLQPQRTWSLKNVWYKELTTGEADNSAMLDLNGTAALEGCFILVCAQTKRIPKPDRVLHTQLLCWVEAAIAGGLSKEVTSNLGLTASTQRRGSVQAPVSPSGASQSILTCEAAAKNVFCYPRSSTVCQEDLDIRNSAKQDYFLTNQCACKNIREDAEQNCLKIAARSKRLF